MLPPASATRNVFLTGAATALGREVTRMLVARGHRVTGLTEGAAGAALVRQAGGIPAFSDPLRVGEIRSVLHSAQAEVALHLAPQTLNGFPNRHTDWEAGQRGLREGSYALLEAAQAAGVGCVVILSYAFLYGDQGGEWVTEDTPLAEQPLFGAALAAEELARHHPVPTCILRAGFIYGPDEPSTRMLGEALRRGRGVYVGREDAFHNWVHLADLAQAVVLAAEQMPGGALFNVVDDQPAPAAAVVDHLAVNLGLPAPARLPDLPLLSPISMFQRLLLGASARVQNVRAKSGLGWAPRYPSYAAGLEQTLLAWRAEQPAVT